MTKISKFEPRKYFFIDQVDIGIHDNSNIIDFITYQNENSAAPTAKRVDMLTSDIKAFLLTYWEVSSIYFSPAAKKAFKELLK